MEVSTSSGGDRSKIYDRDGTNTSSDDPEMMQSRIFIGNLKTNKVKILVLGLIMIIIHVHVYIIIIHVHVYIIIIIVIIICIINIGRSLVRVLRTGLQSTERSSGFRYTRATGLSSLRLGK